MQAWLDRYLKHRDNDRHLLGTLFHYLEPTGDGKWAPVTLHSNRLLSFYFCSAHDLDGVREVADLTGVG